MKSIHQRVAAVVFELKRLEKLSIRSSLFRVKTMEMQRGYKSIPGKMFSGIKSDFCQVLLESRTRGGEGN